jgi:sn-glycerol 3-phosphate transport system permease protein
MQQAIQEKTLDKEIVIPALREVKKAKRFSVKPYLYLLPAFITFITFIFYPFLKTIYLSFTITNPRGEVKSFVGIDNYKDILTSPDFFKSVIVTLKFVPMLVIPSMVIGLILALLAYRKIRGSAVYEVMFSMPMAVASAPAAIVWTMLFHPSIGLINYVFGTNIGWLTDEKWGLISVSIVTVWLNIGVNFIFLVTGLKGIPEELLESSDIDGAGFFRKLFKMIIPLVSPTLFFVLFFNVVNAFQAFGQIKILTGGGPADSTNVLVYSIYKEAFMNNRFETACVQSLVLFFMMLIVTLLQFKFEKKGVHYS